MREEAAVLSPIGHSDGSWRTIFPFREVVPPNREIIQQTS